MIYDDRSMKVGSRVKVYWNLHKNCYSVVSLEKRKRGLVVAHVERLNLENAVFKVSQKGRERVLREKRKNVHAYIEGFITNKIPLISEQISYNPYRLPFFHTVDGTKVDSRRLTLLEIRKNRSPSICGEIN